MKFNLKGVAGVIAMVVIVTAIITYRVFLLSDLAKNPEIREQLETNLMSEIYGDIMAVAKAMKETMDRGDNKTASALAKDVLKRKVEIHDLAMRRSGVDIIVKATYDRPWSPRCGKENRIF